MKAELARTLLTAAEVLDALRLRWAVVGGLAVNAWATPRATKDVDLYAELPVATRAKLRADLETRGFHVPAMEEELKQWGVFRSRSREGVFLDIFDAVGPLGESILGRRRELLVENRRLWFCSPEDVAVLKAFSDRERDFPDLVKLLRLGKRIDVQYIERWAELLDQSLGGDEVSSRFQRALVETKKPMPQVGRKRRSR